MGKGEIPLVSKYLYCRHVKTRACLGKGKLYHTIATFNEPQKEGLLKTIWEKGKMLVNIKSSNFKLWSAKPRSLSLSQSKVLSSGKELKHVNPRGNQQSNLRLNSCSPVPRGKKSISITYYED